MGGHVHQYESLHAGGDGMCLRGSDVLSCHWCTCACVCARACGVCVYVSDYTLWGMCISVCGTW